MDNGSDVSVLADTLTLSLFETNFAKETRNLFDCRGKPLDCFNKVCKGLQCGLSGNQAL